MSTATIATILLLGVFLVLVFLRVPVVYAIGVASLLDFFSILFRHKPHRNHTRIIYYTMSKDLPQDRF